MHFHTPVQCWPKFVNYTQVRTVSIDLSAEKRVTIIKLTNLYLPYFNILTDTICDSYVRDESNVSLKT